MQIPFHSETLKQEWKKNTPLGSRSWPKIFYTLNALLYIGMMLFGEAYRVAFSYLEHGISAQLVKFISKCAEWKFTIDLSTYMYSLKCTFYNTRMHVLRRERKKGSKVRKFITKIIKKMYSFMVLSEPCQMKIYTFN